jgi:GT2 family glycosyltransferase
MTDRPLVSVVTGTWQRHELLLEAIDNARDQTYPNIEHVVVSDGPDPELRALIEDARERGGEYVPIVFAELGFHSGDVLSDSRGAAPFMVAQLLASGEYQITLSDDERFLVPDAIEAMVDLLEMRGVDFVYPLVECWERDYPEKVSVIGIDPPTWGQVTHFLYRRDILDVLGGGFRLHVGTGTDWDQIERWKAAGKRWAHLPRVTLRHRIG